MAFAELDEKPQLRPVDAPAVQAVQVGEVFLVGGKDQVEVREIRRRHLPGPPGDGVASGFQGGSHPGVRSFARMVSGRSGGIDADAVRQSGLIDPFPENDFGGRRTADVAHADEKHTEVPRHGRILVCRRLAAKGKIPRFKIAQLSPEAGVPHREIFAMKNTMTIGIAALLAGAAGGFMAGKASSGGDDSSSTAAVTRDLKTQRPGAVSEGESRGARPRNIDEILSEPGQLARIQALMDLYAGMDATQLQAEADKLERLPMAQRIMASLLLFGRWAEVDPMGALAHTDRMGFGGMFVRPTILQSWASVDPENAAKYFSENPRQFAMMGGPGGGGPMGGDGGASVIAGEWAKLDPEAALAWANGLQGRDKTGALASVIREMAGKDPAKAAEVASTLSGDDQARAYREIAGQWGGSDFTAAKAWINGLPADARDEALAVALSSFASSDPTAAAAEVASLSQGRDRDRAVEDVAQAWARKDPAAAAAWVVQQQTDDPDDAIRGVMMNWANQDPAGAVAFINQQPQGELRDEAISTYVFSNRNANPQEAITLAESIGDDGARNRAIGMTAMRWMREDEAAARAYIQNSTAISEGARERILEGRGMWGGRGGRGGRGR